MNGMVRWRLTLPQIRMAALVAIDRRLFALEERLEPAHGGDDNWDDDIKGCCAEFAVALYTNLSWHGSVGKVGKNAVPDVGGMIEVKSMRVRNRRLVMHKDSKNLPHVCTFVDLPFVELHGWMHARDGKQDRYWCDPAKKNAHAYFIDPPYRPMAELCAWVDLEGWSKNERRGRQAVA